MFLIEYYNYNTEERNNNNTEYKKRKGQHPNLQQSFYRVSILTTGSGFRSDFVNMDHADLDKSN